MKRWWRLSTRYGTKVRSHTVTISKTAHQTHRKHRSHIQNEVPCDKGQAMTPLALVLFTNHLCILLDVWASDSADTQIHSKDLFERGILHRAERGGLFFLGSGLFCRSRALSCRIELSHSVVTFCYGAHRRAGVTGLPALVSKLLHHPCHCSPLRKGPTATGLSCLHRARRSTHHLPPPRAKPWCCIASTTRADPSQPQGMN